MKRFVFLDRDGTLVRDEGYTHRISDYALLPGVASGLRRLQAAGFGLAVVTNQSGIGRGLYSEADYQAFQQHMAADLSRQGVQLSQSFHCPHRPEAGCACRKPAPGLLLQARDTLGAELSQSWMIGDMPRDAEAALQAGCRGSVLVGDAEAAAPGALRAADFSEAVELLLAHAAAD
jgi:D-glycero-D-manno-heptose 1,7-bisphosphate phosphatase